MAKQSYNKPPLSYSQQVQKWIDRGLQVTDTYRAQSYLSHISYYRLSAYALPFQSKKDEFDKGTTFDDVLNLYLFDRELRLLILDGIERIEIGFRTKIIHDLANKYGSHWQDNQKVFRKDYKNHKGEFVRPYKSLQKYLDKQYHSSDPEVFIKHYFDKYDKPKNPPSWMAIELVTIGGLSRLYSNLRGVSDKKIIAKNYKLHYKVFQSWFHAITHLRNLCAHHCRVWNREYRITPSYLKNPKFNWVDHSFNINNRTFYYLHILKYFLNIIIPTNSFKDRLNALYIKYPNVNIAYMGLPSDLQGQIKDWKKEPLWKK